MRDDCKQGGTGIMEKATVKEIKEVLDLLEKELKGSDDSEMILFKREIEIVVDALQTKLNLIDFFNRMEDDGK